MDNNSDELAEFVESMSTNGFVSEIQNGQHRTKFQDADKVARLIESLGKVGKLNSSTTRTIGTRIRTPVSPYNYNEIGD